MLPSVRGQGRKRQGEGDMWADPGRESLGFVVLQARSSTSLSVYNWLNGHLFLAEDL